jgi:hypothetical protein
LEPPHQFPTTRLTEVDRLRNESAAINPAPQPSASLLSGPNGAALGGSRPLGSGRNYSMAIASFLHCVKPGSTVVRLGLVWAARGGDRVGRVVSLGHG